MRTKALLALFAILVLLLTAVTAAAQDTEPPEGARIASAQVSGFDITKLSPGLQQDIGKLSGTALNRQLLRDLAARLEAEQPRYVAAIRTTQDADGSARVTFVVARIPGQGRDTNINSKYIVDTVEVRGVPDRDISPDLRQDLQTLAGKALDSEAADRLDQRLRSEFPQHDVSRRTSRAREQGHVTLVYVLSKAEWARWLRFEAIDGNALYHSDQGWGAVLPLSFVSKDVLVMPVFAWDTADDLVEEYSGFGVRVESRRLGTDRLGFFFEWSTHDPKWREPTLLALALNPQLPGAYGDRMSVTPLLKFAFLPQLSVAGGVGITQLEPFADDLDLRSQMANVAIGSIRYRQQWGGSSKRPAREAGATFTLRKGTTALESDFSYDRYLAEADYAHRFGKQRLIVSGMGGRITGSAPLFERFTLGDSRTLRGWNKYDINPAGGDRMFHTSVEYHVHDVLLFLDAGSVWNTGTEKRVRFSTGAGFSPGPLFMTLGFPLNTDEFRAIFTIGFRFGMTSTGVKKY
jgi:hypothetical protein